jgi:hypothetical protein
VYSRLQYTGLVCKVSLHETRVLIFDIDHSRKEGCARRLRDNLGLDRTETDRDRPIVDRVESN